MKATVYMLALFAAGGICGAVISRKCLPPPQPQTLRIGRADEIAAKIKAKLADRLQLTADQMAKADPLILAASQELEKSHKVCLGSIETAISQLHHEMRPFLTDDQLARLVILDKERADTMMQKYNFCISSTNGSTN